MYEDAFAEAGVDFFIGPTTVTPPNPIDGAEPYQARRTPICTAPCPLRSSLSLLRAPSETLGDQMGLAVAIVPESWVHALQAVNGELVGDAMIRHTFLDSSIQCPAVSLSAGLTESGLPIGFQVSGLPGQTLTNPCSPQMLKFGWNSTLG